MYHDMHVAKLTEYVSLMFVFYTWLISVIQPPHIPSSLPDHHFMSACLFYKGANVFTCQTQ